MLCKAMLGYVMLCKVMLYYIMCCYVFVLSVSLFTEVKSIWALIDILIFVSQDLVT